MGRATVAVRALSVIENWPVTDWMQRELVASAGVSMTKLPLYATGAQAPQVIALLPLTVLTPVLPSRACASTNVWAVQLRRAGLLVMVMGPVPAVVSPARSRCTKAELPSSLSARTDKVLAPTSISRSWLPSMLKRPPTLVRLL